MYKSYRVTYESKFSNKHKEVEIVAKNVKEALLETARYAEQDIKDIWIYDVVELLDWQKELDKLLRK